MHPRKQQIEATLAGYAAEFRAKIRGVIAAVQEEDGEANNWGPHDEDLLVESFRIGFKKGWNALVDDIEEQASTIRKNRKEEALEEWLDDIIIEEDEEEEGGTDGWSEEDE